MSIRPEFSHYNHTGGHGTPQYVRKETKSVEIDQSTRDCCSAILCGPVNGTTGKIARIAIWAGIGASAGAIGGSMIPGIGTAGGAVFGGIAGTGVGVYSIMKHD